MHDHLDPQRNGSAFTPLFFKLPPAGDTASSPYTRLGEDTGNGSGARAREHTEKERERTTRANSEDGEGEQEGRTGG